MEIVSAKYLLTLDKDPLIDGAISVENGEIIDMGREEDLLARYKGALQMDFPNHALMPGLINAHTHLNMTHHKDYPFDPVRNYSVEVNFIDWLLTSIDYKKNATSEVYRSAVEKGIEACVESGVTCVGDMGSYEGIFECLDQSGLRAVVFPEVLSYDSFIAKDLYQTALALVEKYMDYESDLVNVGIGPYSAYTLSRNILRIMAQYSRSSGLAVAMHVAESFSEMEFFYDSSGDIANRLFPNIGWGDDLPPNFRKTPITYLHEIDFLEAAPILIGCINARPNDLDYIVRSNSKVVWTPRSNNYLQLGQPPVDRMISKGVLVAIGTEGISSTNTLSLWDELRAAKQTVTENQWDISAEILFKMVTKNAALALGISEEVGTLTIGKKADYIVIDTKHHPDTGDIYENLINHTKGYNVHKVVVNGQTLKQIN